VTLDHSQAEQHVDKVNEHQTIRGRLKPLGSAVLLIYTWGSWVHELLGEGSQRVRAGTALDVRMAGGEGPASRMHRIEMLRASLKSYVPNGKKLSRGEGDSLPSEESVGVQELDRTVWSAPPSSVPLCVR
jgi:hypothetical protein